MSFQSPLIDICLGAVDLVLVYFGYKIIENMMHPPLPDWRTIGPDFTILTLTPPPPPKPSCTDIPTLTGVPRSLIKGCGPTPSFSPVNVKGWYFFPQFKPDLGEYCKGSIGYDLAVWNITPPPECKSPPFTVRPDDIHIKYI